MLQVPCPSDSESSFQFQRGKKKSLESATGTKSQAIKPSRWVKFMEHRIQSRPILCRQSCQRRRCEHTAHCRYVREGFLWSSPGFQNIFSWTRKFCSQGSVDMLEKRDAWWWLGTLVCAKVDFGQRWPAGRIGALSAHMLKGSTWSHILKGCQCSYA